MMFSFHYKELINNIIFNNFFCFIIMTRALFAFLGSSKVFACSLLNDLGFDIKFWVYISEKAEKYLYFDVVDHCTIKKVESKQRPPFSVLQFLLVHNVLNDLFFTKGK